MIDFGPSNGPITTFFAAAKQKLRWEYLFLNMIKTNFHLDAPNEDFTDTFHNAVSTILHLKSYCELPKFV